MTVTALRQCIGRVCGAGCQSVSGTPRGVWREAATKIKAMAEARTGARRGRAPSPGRPGGDGIGDALPDRSGQSSIAGEASPAGRCGEAQAGHVDIKDSASCLFEVTCVRPIPQSSLLVEICVSEIGLVLHLFGERLIVGGLKRSRIDLRQEITRLDVLAFGEGDLHQFAIDPRLDRNRVLNACTVPRPVR